MKVVSKAITTERNQEELIESSITSKLTDMMIDAIIEIPIQMLLMTPIGDEEGKQFGSLDSPR
jgi:hypothetical protein